MQEQLMEAIAPYRDRVDYLEVRLEQSESTAISFRGAQLDAVPFNGLDGAVSITTRLAIYGELDGMDGGFCQQDACGIEVGKRGNAL